MRTISVRFGYMAAVLSVAGLFQVYNAPLSLAAPNPGSCFTTTGVATRTITNYNFAGTGCGAVVEIPSTISGGTVVSIGTFAFHNKPITSVVIPNSVTSIGAHSFYNSPLLTSVTIPNSVTSIGNSAFDSTGLTSLTIPNSVTSIGNSAFSRTDLTSIVIPSSITSISDYAFGDNDLLSSVSIPTSVTSIGSGAFYASNISSITIPNSVTSIGQGAFYLNHLTEVTIPNSVTSIASYAFEMNKISSVTIGNSVTTIGDSAFIANRITSVTIPSSVTSIGEDVFKLQSPHGADIWGKLYDDDLTVIQEAVNSIWYVQLFTENPSNPTGFTDTFAFETTELDGLDDDYNEPFTAGGYIVNPTTAEIQFVDAATNQLLDPVFLTGQTPSGSEYYHDYISSNGPTFPYPANPYSPTASEKQVVLDALSQYYRAGSTLSYTAASINGIAPTPTSYSFVLGASAASNQRQFVYVAVTTSPSQSGGQLASTGLSLWLVAAAAGAVVLGSMTMIGKKS